MASVLHKIANLARQWYRGEEALAATEATLVFPILLTLLLGVFDMGNGILANQKTIRASQVVGDIITRSSSVSDIEIQEAIEAGRLALEPLDASSFGIDIVSIRFDEDSNAEIVWRETQGMPASDSVLESVAPLAEANNGVVVVTVKYVFEPVFAGFIVNDIPMTEVAFTRGRKSPVVNKE